MTDSEDLRNYKTWLKAALVDEGLANPSTRFNREAAADWETMLPEHQKQFADGVRNIWDAQREVTGASLQLRRAADDAIRADVNSAADARDELLAGIEARIVTLDELITLMTHLQEVQKSATGGQFFKYLEAYLQQRLDAVEDDAFSSFDRQDVLKLFEGLEWDNDVLAQLSHLAMQINEDLSDEKPASPPAKGSSSSSRKRKRNRERGNDASPSKRKYRSRNISAEAGAAPSRGQGVTPEVPGTESAGDFTPEQPFPRPDIGVVGTYAAWIFKYEQSFDPEHKSWVHRQLRRADCRTMDDLEPLAELLVRFHKQVHIDHDWENEEDVPVNPVMADYLDHHRPNVDRLFRMVHVPGAVDCQAYIFRHLYTFDEKMHEDADEIAFGLIPVVLKKGLVHDWGNERDLYTIPPPTATEAASIPLEGVSVQAPGQWTVGIPVTSVRTTCC